MSGFLSDASGPYIVAAPGDDRDYSIDWTALLSNPGEAISNSTWTVPVGVTPGVEGFVGNIATQWLTTPNVGTFFILNTMTTNQGREFNRGFRLIVSENI